MLKLKTKIFLIIPLLFSVLFCGILPGTLEKEDNSLLLGLILVNNQRGLTISSTKDLAWESNDDYNLNQFGLITTPTLKAWLENWEANKPAHITGKLVVLQNSATQPSWGLLKGSSSNVKSYFFDFNSTSEGFIQTRHNGLVNTISIVPEGERIDRLLNLYGIDPVNDLIVLASVSSQESHYQPTLRAFYAFYYWGVDKRNIAILNGTLSSPNIRSGLPTSSNSDIPGISDKKYSVKSLTRNNTILMLPLEDTMQAVANPRNHGVESLSGGVFVGDARSIGEYNGVSSSGGSYHPITNPNAISTPAPDTRYLGTLKGARHTPWQIFQTGAPNHSFKPKSELRAIYNDQNYKLGDTIIQLCRTNFRTQITGFATIGILGYPTTYYDGAWIEWGNLVSGGGNPTLPASSRFRTDLEIYTERGSYNSIANSTPTPDGLNVLASTSRQIVLDDLNYKK